MSFSALLQIIKSRLWLIVLLPVVAAGVGWLAVSLRPPSYVTGATILIDYRKPLEGELAGELLPVGLQTGYLATQIDIIKSQPVAERVIELLGILRSPQWRARFGEDMEGEGKDVGFVPWVVKRLQDQVEVTTAPESRLIKVWFRDRDPELAAAVANAFVEAYRGVSKSLAQHPAQETAESVEQVLATLRGELERAEGRVSGYQARMGIVATEEPRPPT